MKVFVVIDYGDYGDYFGVVSAHSTRELAEKAVIAIGNNTPEEGWFFYDGGHYVVKELTIKEER